MCPSQCPIYAQHVYKLGHTLYTRATAWPLLVLGHSLYTTLVLLGHCLCMSCTASLGTVCILEGYCLGTFGTLYRATCLDTSCAQLAHYFSTSLSTTCSCALLYYRIQNVMVNRQQQNNNYKTQSTAYLVKINKRANYSFNPCGFLVLILWVSGK